MRTRQPPSPKCIGAGDEGRTGTVVHISASTRKNVPLPPRPHSPPGPSPHDAWLVREVVVTPEHLPPPPPPLPGIPGQCLPLSVPHPLVQCSSGSCGAVLNRTSKDFSRCSFDSQCSSSFELERSESDVCMAGSMEELAMLRVQNKVLCPGIPMRCTLCTGGGKWHHGLLWQGGQETPKTGLAGLGQGPIDQATAVNSAEGPEQLLWGPTVVPNRVPCTRWRYFSLVARVPQRPVSFAPNVGLPVTSRAP